MRKRISKMLLLAGLAWWGSPVLACGGFFCELTPIDQAGEQIVFHQQGDEVTAMVRILYQVDAESFSWVVPVPNSPTLSVGDDLTFDRLDQATRPQFQLTTEGESCVVPLTDMPSVSPSVPSAEEGDVTVEETLSVGPFAIEIVSSSNPQALADWLIGNGYDLTERGTQLITPYVEEGMKFVALKLRSGQSTGSIQPLIMKYQSSTPTIPIRLTAVAAQEDMGVLTWVVGDSRAVPDNYLHVIPNYTRLNWYTGFNNAYASYQSLITAAMNEAGGQGFATDMAAPIDSELVAALPNAEQLRDSLAQLDNQNDANFLSGLITSTQAAAFQAAVSETLPLRNGEDASIYFEPLALLSNYTAEELSAARASLRQAYIDLIITPVENSMALLPAGRYLTRLYTTLSADEMTLDPTFVYNTSMPDQAATREAKLVQRCDSNGTHWTLTLGEGTGRNGETVIIANSVVPVSPPPEVREQESTATIERTSADADPQVLTENTFATVFLGDSPDMITVDDDGGGFLGSLNWGWFMLLGLIAFRISSHIP